MLKYAVSLVLVYSITVVFLAAPVVAQTDQPPAKSQASAPAEVEISRSAPDLKTIFDKESAEFRAQTAAFDPVKTERENARQQAQKKGWSKTKKTLVITAIVVGIAAVTFLVIKYYKKCLRYSDDCTFNPDTGIEECPCEEYEQRNP